jgi:cell division protein FtsQ
MLDASRLRAGVDLGRTRRALTLLPSAQSTTIALLLALLAFAGYIGARQSSAFAITTVEVRGAPATVAAKVRRALDPLVGTSLLDLRRGDVDDLALALPEVAAVSYDRSFPHSLVLRVEAEQPLAVARSGADAWLVSTNSRVLAALPRRARLSLPRLWLSRSADIAVGDTLDPGAGAEEIAALLPVAGAGMGGRVATVNAGDGRVVYKLRSGVEVRAGRLSDLRLKLAVAARILRQNAVREYLDVSVPERPVGVVDPQLSG